MKVQINMKKLEDPDMFGIYEGTNISKFPTLKKKKLKFHTLIYT